MRTHITNDPAAIRRTASRPLNKLNDLAIKKAIKDRQAIGSGCTILFDGGGLHARIEADGSVRWKQRYTKADGGRGEIGLGGYPAITLAAVREVAGRNRDLAATGIDLVEAKREARAKAKVKAAIPTFGEAADRYVDVKVEPVSTNKKHLHQWRQTLGDTYCASIRPKKVDRIEMDDIVRVLMQPITRTQRHAKSPITGPLWTVMPETASRLANRIERVLDFATVEGHRTGENPGRWVGRLEHRLHRVIRAKTHQASMHYRAVPGFIGALRDRDAVSACALEFLILTACRSGEVRGATWSEIDLEAAVWTIPAARMKSRAEHRVPLGPRAIEILLEMSVGRHLVGLVFPSTKPGQPLSDMTFKALMDRMNVTDATAHGFRSSFRDWAGDEYGADDDIAEAALAHRWGSSVKRAYRRNPAFERRRDLMLAWDAYCSDAAAADNVVRLRA